MCASKGQPHKLATICDLKFIFYVIFLQSLQTDE